VQIPPVRSKFQAKKNPLNAGLKLKTMEERSLISTQRMFERLHKQHHSSPKNLPKRGK